MSELAPHARDYGRSADGSLWVFGYGSLIWNPEMEVAARHLGRVHGYHRDFCVHSVVHRGTPERTGLVLGLAPGGACNGLLIQVPAHAANEAIQTLDARELVTSVYLPKQLRVIGLDGPVQARSYVCDVRHEQYAGRLTLETQVERIIGAVGERGPNEEYLFETVAALRTWGIHDGRLEALEDKIRAQLA